MVRTACEIDPYDLTRIVHGGRRCARGAGEINRRQRSFVEQKAVTLDSARTASISADDMARIVDAEGHRERFARNDDWGKSKIGFERSDRTCPKQENADHKQKGPILDSHLASRP